MLTTFNPFCRVLQENKLLSLFENSGLGPKFECSLSLFRLVPISNLENARSLSLLQSIMLP